MNTIILFCNQADSSFDNEIFKMNIEEIEEANESNSVYSELYFDDYKLFVDSSQRVGAGDRFFVFCYGGNYCGIFCSGYLTSDYYEYEEQLNDGRLIGNLDLAPDYIIHPDYFQILTVDILKEAIPDIEWDDNVYGRFITKEQSQKIDSLWRDFLDKNSGIFVRWSAKQNYDFEFYLPQDEEIVHIGLSDEGKIKAHNYRCEIDIICDDINSAEEKAREIIENKYGNTKNIKFEYHYGFICNSDYTEKALRILMETCNGLKDDSGRPYIESVIKAARIDTLDGPRMLLMLLKLLDDGLITEDYLREKALPESVLETIHILVNKDSESYESYIEKVSRNKQALNLMIDVLSDRLNIIYKYKELKAEDLEDLNKWLKAYHKLSEIRRSGLVSV